MEHSAFILTWHLILILFFHFMQFSDVGQSKVPVFLGGMSVLVCLLSVVTALAISFLMIPQQVTPWTGLVLMYEWTFTIFFLLFGSYLHLITRWGKIVANRTASISSPPGSFEYDSGKGWFPSCSQESLNFSLVF